MEKGSTSILPDDEKPKYVFNEAKKMWIDIENPDEEKETPALPPRSTFAGQPEAAQSIIKNPIATGDSMKNKSSGKNFKKNSLWSFSLPRFDQPFKPVEIERFPIINFCRIVTFRFDQQFAYFPIFWVFLLISF